MSSEDPAIVEEARALASYEVQRLRADNPSPLTLSGTNTWIVGRDPAWVIDPGPALDEHLELLVSLLTERGGLGGVALTHDHLDHSEGVAPLLERLPAPLAAARGRADLQLSDGMRFGPLLAIATPGHAPDHFAFQAGRVCFAGDTVLGEGSVFVAPGQGALAGYLDGLERLSKLELDVLCPGHGPAIWKVKAKLEEYIEHRSDRERRLLDALAEGRRTTAELLDAAWSEVPSQLRIMAQVTLIAHLEKLSEEGRLPADVQWPSW